MPAAVSSYDATLGISRSSGTSGMQLEWELLRQLLINVEQPASGLNAAKALTQSSRNLLHARTAAVPRESFWKRPGCSGMADNAVVEAMGGHDLTALRDGQTVLSISSSVFCDARQSRREIVLMLQELLGLGLLGETSLFYHLNLGPLT